MAFDYKKEYKELYTPKAQPAFIQVPPMNYMAVQGKGDPNAENSEYKESVALLYPVAFTLKMSARSGRNIQGFFDYVVPPLEGFWWLDGETELNFEHKSDFRFLSVIRLPDFVTEQDLQWAVEDAQRKKKTDFSKVRFLRRDEGFCVQCMHIGSYDDEPSTIARMYEYCAHGGYAPDLTGERLHHEIYLSDPRRTAPERCKTVLRLPIRPL